MKGFLIGLGIGVGLGFLFAPRAGEELRNDIAQRASDLADSARSTFEEGRERIRSVASAARGSETGTATGTEGARY